MKTKYILAIDSGVPSDPQYKIWLPMNMCVFNLNSHGIINAITECDILCDVNTHEKYIEIEKLGARNPIELRMKLDLYPNLYLEI